MIKKYILLIFTALTLTACHDETIKVLTMEHAIESDNAVVLKWTNPNIRGFKHYQIMRSNESGSYTTINNPETNPEASKQDITTFTDYTYPLLDSVYYKIIAIGDEVISSANICVKLSKPIVFNNSIYSALPVNGTEKMVIANYNNGYKLSLYNTSSKSIETQIEMSSFSSNDYYSIERYNNVAELHYYSSYNDRLYIYNALTLSQIGVSPYVYLSSPKIINDKNGNIIMISSTSSYIYTLNRKTFALSQYYASHTLYDIKYDSISNTLLAIGSSAVLKYNLSNDGIVTSLSGTKQIPAYTYYWFIENTDLLYKASTSSSYVYDYVSGTTSNISSTIGFTKIYKVKGYLYCLSNGNSIYCYNANTYEFTKIITTRSVPASLSFDDNYLYYFGYYSGNNNYYLIAKTKLL